MEISKWRDETGISLIDKPETDVIKWALGLNETPEDLGEENWLRQYNKAILVLSNYYLYLESECGLSVARFAYSLDLKKNGVAVDEEVIMDNKAKMNILRPILDGLKNKIDALRKIYDMQIRKSYESRNIRG